MLKKNIFPAEQVITGLDLAVATMKRGEVAQVIIDHEYGFGNKKIYTNLAVVPPLSTLYYDVELVSFTKVRIVQQYLIFDPEGCYFNLHFVFMVSIFSYCWQN